MSGGERIEKESEPCKPTTSVAPTHFVRREDRGKTEIRSRVLPVRFTPVEYQQISEGSLASNISRSEYVRRAARGRKLPPPATPEVNRAAYEKLCRIGSRLNDVLEAIHDAENATAAAKVLAEVQGGLRTLGFKFLEGRRR